MKLMASILMLYFGLLMMQPFYSMDVIQAKPVVKCNGKMCCKQSHLPDKTNTCNNMRSCTAMCSAFVPSGFSTASYTWLVDFNNPVLELSKNKKPAVNDNITSDYLSDCWHPPKLAA